MPKFTQLMNGGSWDVNWTESSEPGLLTKYHTVSLWKKIHVKFSNGNT